jgi:regulator of telomere elongation helicase 1
VSPQLSGSDWYTQQALRAVNQAIGRVIRHRNDWGAIIFCDSRMSSRAYRDQLSMWLRPFVTECPDFAYSQRLLHEFFRRVRLFVLGFFWYHRRRE